MPKYKITWEEKQYWESIVEAESEEEALAHWKKDSDYLNNHAESIENEYIHGTAKISEVDDE